MPDLKEVAPTFVEKTGGLLNIRPRGDTAEYARSFSGASKNSKQIGDRAEAVIYEHLKATLSPEFRLTLKWDAKEGGTPGWDISYEGESGQRVVVEVKGTSESCFPSIELTDGEFSAAKREGENYWLYLVTKCLTKKPVVGRIQNPAKLVSEGKMTASPTGWRLSLHQADEQS